MHFFFIHHDEGLPFSFKLMLVIILIQIKDCCYIHLIFKNVAVSELHEMSFRKTSSASVLCFTKEFNTLVW